MKYSLAVAIFAAILMLGSCIKNDIPYPRIVQSILTLKAQGDSLPANIDEQTLSATVYLAEQVDIMNVKFEEFTYTDGAECSTDLLEGTYNMSLPLPVSLSKYQTYDWSISAVQEIERYFTVESQIGSTLIDVPAHRVIIRVPSSENLAALTLTSVKLGPADVSTMSPEIQPGKINLVHPLDIDVTAFGRTERWTIYAEKVEFVVNTSSADAWSKIVWVYGESKEGIDRGFQYRLTTSSEWIDVPEEYITQDGGSYFAYIPHLTPLTEYVVRAVAGEDVGAEIRVTTQATELLPDGSFDQWWLDDKVWNPWNRDGERFWDTGNTGAATVGSSNSAPSDYTPDGQGKSARLETIFAGFGALGKLASGSIFTGKYARTDGFNGVLDFGRPWTSRPTKLRGYFQYQTAIIDRTSVNGEFGYLKGRPDSCHIYVALTDWTAPYEIRTNPKDRQLFDKNMPSVIAYGELIYSGTMDRYQEFVIPLEYRSTSRVPSYIQITVSSSKYGDYFTGGVGALLYVDQFSLDYDY